MPAPEVAAPAVAPVTAPAAAPAPPVAPVLSGHDRALALLKTAAAEPETPPVAEVVAPATPPPAPVVEPVAEDTPKQFAKVARAHQKLLADKAAAKAEIERERAEIATSKADLEIVTALKAGDFGALDKLLGENWYDKATEATIKKLHPHSAEAQIAEMRAEQAKKDREAGEARERAVKESNDRVAEMRTKNISGFRENAQTVIKADERFTSLRGEDPQEVAEVVWGHLERQYDATKKTPTQDDALGLLLRLEAAVRARNDLTKPPQSGTPKSGGTESIGTVTAGSPSNEVPKAGANTLTAGAHGSMPVDDWRATTATRKAAALALLRAAMKEE